MSPASIIADEKIKKKRIQIYLQLLLTNLLTITYNSLVNRQHTLTHRIARGRMASALIAG
jgi:hypothetical protein